MLNKREREGNLNLKRRGKAAFTLAEVLITLAVIGVIAVVVIPAITVNMQSKARERQMEVAKHKFAKAMEQVALNNGIGPYYGDGDDATEKFVDILQLYYKTAKICDNENLDECFGYKEFKFSNGDTFDIRKAKNGTIFKDNKGNFGDSYNSNTMGIIGLDGTRFVLAFDKECKALDQKVYAWQSKTSNEAMGCIAGIIDIDGNKAPNTVGKDVSFIGNATSIGAKCIFEVNGLCVSAFIPLTAVEYSECVEMKDTWGIQYCEGEANGKTSSKDLYAAAAKACGTKDKMLTAEEICNVLELAYTNMSYTSSNGGGCNSTTYISGTLAGWGVEESSSLAYIWANYEESVGPTNHAIGKYVNFSTGGVWNGTKLRDNYSLTSYALCKL